MKKSFMDRIFPSPGPLLPQHEDAEPLTRRSSESPASTGRIRLLDNIPTSIPNAITNSLSLRSSPKTASTPEIKQKTLQSAPLSASVLHHDDPFLPIDRAARALQDAIQSLLDIQSRALNGRMNGLEQDEVTSHGSLTPTQSVVTPRSRSGMRAVPIRQPLKKTVGLRGARKGLSRKMRQFVELREEELQVLEIQNQARITALERVKDLEAKREACVAEIDNIRKEDTTETVVNLKTEANTVKMEIEELEHRLLELRVRHRHLLNQADQLESSMESKVSSFNGTIAMVDEETRRFLRRPPVSHPLADGSDIEQLGMYALNPERRTLEMAREQWAAENETLVQRKAEVESECNALREGERVWTEDVDLIEEFEKNLRGQTAQLTTHSEQHPRFSMESVMHELATMIERLESDLALAESKNWNLLICTIGAELDAFHQAREMFEQTQRTVDASFGDAAGLDATTGERFLPHGGNGQASVSPSRSVESNQSLKDTLHEFSSNANATKAVSQKNAIKYESEDDEPPADFLLSH